MQYTPQIGDLLLCPKLPFIEHKGTFVGSNRVLHNTRDRGEHVSTVAEFSEGKPVTVVPQRCNPAAVWNRVRRILSRPKKYDVVNRNCEHTAFEAITGKAKSPTLVAFLCLLALIAIIGFATRRR